MKKALALTALLLLVFSTAQATLVTNYNQSAQYIRMLSRNASTDVDAVYFNPAGLVKMADGWHFALHNQTIGQEKTIISGYPLLNQAEYIGEVNAPIFPSVFAVYKKDRLAVSFGFGPNAGGGSADFMSGLPSFEIPFSGIPMLLSGMGLPTTAYSADIEFSGTSIFLGFQGGVSYAVSDMLSLSAGMRYITATNTYEGSIANVMINPGHPLINPTASMIPAAGFFTLIGQPGYAALMADKEVDAKQTGSAITPILGLNFSPSDQLNIGIRYEFNTSLELVNDTTRDDTGMFPDGAKSQNDIPAILGIGIQYHLLPQLRTQLSLHYTFDKNADWDGNEDNINSNSYELGIGLEYDLTEQLLVSAGYLYSHPDLGDGYQTDLGHDLGSNTVGFGLQYALSPNFDLNLGGLYAQYIDDSRNVTDPMVGQYTNTFKRSAWDLTVGLGFHF